MFTSFSIKAVRDINGDCTVIEDIETQNELDLANINRLGKFFWTVYGRSKDGMTFAIADFNDSAEAMFTFQALKEKADRENNNEKYNEVIKT